MTFRGLHMNHLALANHVRTRRSALRKRIASGEVRVLDVVEHPPEEMLTASLEYVLMSVHRVGRATVLKVCRCASVNPLIRLGDMTDRQRSAVLEEMAQVPRLR